MPSYEHHRLLNRIIQLNTPPDDRNAYANWIEAQDHLAFLQTNSEESELVILAKHDCRFVGHDRTYVDSLFIDRSSVNKLDQEALRSLSDLSSPCNADAAYIEDGESVAIRRGLQVDLHQLSRQATSLAFDRMRKITVDKSKRYIEILQDYVHVSDVHFWPERRAYCRIDNNGDLDEVVSMTCDDSREHILLASFKREPLEQYLATTDSVLVRLFNFDLCRETTFDDLRKRRIDFNKQKCDDVFENDMFYHRKLHPGYMGWTKGVQIVKLSRPRKKLIDSIFNRKTGEHRYLDFEAWDFRNDPNVEMISEFSRELVATDLSNYPGASIPTTVISTNPESTTHYYATIDNQLPFDTSPIFFRPEIIQKYKDDLDKYTVEDGRITCRGGWSIDYDFNEAGQVHTNFRRLKDLPYNEQVYWQSFNEGPKAEMSERAFHHWFKSEKYPGSEPLADVVSVLSRWHEENVVWWKIRHNNLMSRDFSPRTSSREEWARAFMDLSNLVTAGFRSKVIRAKLREAKVDFQDDAQSLALLARLRTTQQISEETSRLEGLREVQAIRNKVAAHVGSSKAEVLSRGAIQSHGSYTAHFNHVCQVVTEELKVIEDLFS